MQFSIDRSALADVLGHATRVVERRTTIPILSNILLAASNGELRIKATDLEREVSVAVAADVTNPGSTTVSAHVLNDVVRKLAPGTSVACASDGSGLMTLKAARSRFTLQTLSADDFPDLATGDMPHMFRMSSVDLSAMIDKTAFAISTEETRYYLNGIYLHPAMRGEVKMLRAVATDGHRLAQCDRPIPDGADGMPGIIVPRKAVHDLHRLLEATDGPIEVSVSPAKVRFVIGPITLVSKLIDGSFPDYQRVIPQSNDKVLKVSNAEFRAAVDRVSTIASERGRAVKLAIGPGKIVLSVTNPEGGRASDELLAEYDHPPIEIGFNARYLLDISGQLESDTMQFLLADPGSPAMVRDGADEQSLYVLMPMRGN